MRGQNNPVGAPVKCDLQFVNSFQDRHGRWRYYFRRKGHKAIALPLPVGSPAFIAAYNDCLAEKAAAEPKIRSKPGTLKALREMYIGSAEFTNLAETTKRETIYVLDALCRHPTNTGTRGDAPVKTLERRHILGWRDKMKDKPGAANKMIRVVKGLMTFAVDRGMRDDNPTLKIKMFKSNPWRDWTDDELVQFEARWPLGTMERTAYALALYTAQRRADVASQKWSTIAGKRIVVRQSKNRTTLAILMHPDLETALKAINPRRGETIITGANGHELNEIYFGHLMAAAIEKAGLPEECVLHGLRKTAARIIEETGGKVRSVTGHLSGQMEQHYSKRASQKKNAENAVLRWARADKKRKEKA